MSYCQILKIKNKKELYFSGKLVFLFRRVKVDVLDDGKFGFRGRVGVYEDGVVFVFLL